MKFNQGHYHEVADRCHVMLCNIEEHLINHPAVAFDECAKKKLQKASDLIAEVYQWAGTGLQQPRRRSGAVFLSAQK